MCLRLFALRQRDAGEMGEGVARFAQVAPQRAHGIRQFVDFGANRHNGCAVRARLRFGPRLRLVPVVLACGGAPSPVCIRIRPKMPATVENSAMPKLPISWFVRAVKSSVDSIMNNWINARISDKRVKSRPR